jgi:acyl-CoA thioesterase-1
MKMKVWVGTKISWLLHAVILAVFGLLASSAYSASKTILVVGDSLSAEYGLARGSGWVALLEQRLREEKIDARIVNASISGDTTSGGKARFPALLKKHDPDIVILELGANDALRGLSLAATEANLRDMITLAREQQAKVLLVGMQIPPNYGADYAQRFADIYPKLAKQTRTAHVPFLFEGLMDRPDLFQPDRIHPTADAQPIMLDTVWPELRPLLKKK